MTVSFTLTKPDASTETVTAQMRLQYRSTREAGNTLSFDLDQQLTVFTAPARLRSGQLVVFCLDSAEAIAVEQLHAQPGRFALSDSDRPELNMSYVPAGQIQLELDEQTRRRFIVSIDYQEIES